MPKDNVEINIRPGLKDITNTVVHLYGVGQYFGKKYNEFGDLWYGNDSDVQKYLSRMDGLELYHVIEEFYRKGKDISHALSIQLPFINDGIRYPVVTKYINETKDCITSSKRKIDELLEKSKTIFLKNENNLKHWKIERFVEIHEEIISVLDSLNNEMESIKNSERYKIENNTLIKNEKLNENYFSEVFAMEEIELIQDLLMKTESLPHRNERELDLLKRTAEMRIRKIFGETSKYLKDLEKINFRPGIYFSGMDDKFYDNSWNGGKSKLLNLLNTIKEEIELNSGKKGTEIAAIKPDKDTITKENIFIIHGSDEAKWRELKGILIDEFKLNPIVLSEKPGVGLTIIEKFEKYARTCSCAMAIFTPDDEVEKNGEKYLQARPNVVYEVGWFCGRLGRDKMILLLKEGTTIFSDFGGIIQQRFTKNISEKTIEIKKDLIQMGILKE